MKAPHIRRERFPSLIRIVLTLLATSFAFGGIPRDPPWIVLEHARVRGAPSPYVTIAKRFIIQEQRKVDEQEQSGVDEQPEKQGAR